MNAEQRKRVCKSFVSSQPSKIASVMKVQDDGIRTRKKRKSYKDLYCEKINQTPLEIPFSQNRYSNYSEMYQNSNYNNTDNENGYAVHKYHLTNIDNEPKQLHRQTKHRYTYNYSSKKFLSNMQNRKYSLFSFSERGYSSLSKKISLNKNGLLRRRIKVNIDFDELDLRSKTSRSNKNRPLLQCIKKRNNNRHKTEEYHFTTQKEPMTVAFTLSSEKKFTFIENNNEEEEEDKINISFGCNRFINNHQTMIYFTNESEDIAHEMNMIKRFEKSMNHKEITQINSSFFSFHDYCDNNALINNNNNDIADSDFPIKYYSTKIGINNQKSQLNTQSKEKTSHKNQSMNSSTDVIVDDIPINLSKTKGNDIEIYLDKEEEGIHNRKVKNEIINKLALNLAGNADQLDLNEKSYLSSISKQSSRKDNNIEMITMKKEEIKLHLYTEDNPGTKSKENKKIIEDNKKVVAKNVVTQKNIIDNKKAKTPIPIKNDKTTTYSTAKNTVMINKNKIPNNYSSKGKSTTEMKKVISISKDTKEVKTSKETIVISKTITEDEVKFQRKAISHRNTKEKKEVIILNEQSNTIQKQDFAISKKKKIDSSKREQINNDVKEKTLTKNNLNVYSKKNPIQKESNGIDNNMINKQQNITKKRLSHKIVRNTYKDMIINDQEMIPSKTSTINQKKGNINNKDINENELLISEMNTNQGDTVETNKKKNKTDTNLVTITSSLGEDCGIKQPTNFIIKKEILNEDIDKDIKQLNYQPEIYLHIQDEKHSKTQKSKLNNHNLQDSKFVTKVKDPLDKYETAIKPYHESTQNQQREQKNKDNIKYDKMLNQLNKDNNTKELINRLLIPITDTNEEDPHKEKYIIKTQTKSENEDVYTEKVTLNTMNQIDENISIIESKDNNKLMKSLKVTENYKENNSYLDNNAFNFQKNNIEQQTQSIVAYNKPNAEKDINDYAELQNRIYNSADKLHNIFNDQINKSQTHLISDIEVYKQDTKLKDDNKLHSINSENETYYNNKGKLYSKKNCQNNNNHQYNVKNKEDHRLFPQEIIDNNTLNKHDIIITNSIESQLIHDKASLHKSLIDVNNDENNKITKQSFNKKDIKDEHQILSIDHLNTQEDIVKLSNHKLSIISSNKYDENNNNKEKKDDSIIENPKNVVKMHTFNPQDTNEMYFNNKDTNTNCIDIHKVNSILQNNKNKINQLHSTNLVKHDCFSFSNNQNDNLDNHSAQNNKQEIITNCYVSQESPLLQKDFITTLGKSNEITMTSEHYKNTNNKGVTDKMEKLSQINNIVRTQHHQESTLINVNNNNSIEGHDNDNQNITLNSIHDERFQTPVSLSIIDEDQGFNKNNKLSNQSNKKVFNDLIENNTHSSIEEISQSKALNYNSTFQEESTHIYQDEKEEINNNNSKDLSKIKNSYDNQRDKDFKRIHSDYNKEQTIQSIIPINENNIPTDNQLNKEKFPQTNIDDHDNYTINSMIDKESIDNHYSIPQIELFKTNQNNLSEFQTKSLKDINQNTNRTASPILYQESTPINCLQRLNNNYDSTDSPDRFNQVQLSKGSNNFSLSPGRNDDFIITDLSLMANTKGYLINEVNNQGQPSPHNSLNQLFTADYSHNIYMNYIQNNSSNPNKDKLKSLSNHSDFKGYFSMDAIRNNEGLFKQTMQVESEMNSDRHSYTDNNYNINKKCIDEENNIVIPIEIKEDNQLDSENKNLIRLSKQTFEKDIDITDMKEISKSKGMMNSHDKVKRKKKRVIVKTMGQHPKQINDGTESVIRNKEYNDNKVEEEEEIEDEEQDDFKEENVNEIINDEMNYYKHKDEITEVDEEWDESLRNSQLKSSQLSMKSPGKIVSLQQKEIESNMNNTHTKSNFFEISNKKSNTKVLERNNQISYKNTIDQYDIFYDNKTQKEHDNFTTSQDIKHANYLSSINTNKDKAMNKDYNFPYQSPQYKNKEIKIYKESNTFNDDNSSFIDTQYKFQEKTILKSNKKNQSTQSQLPLSPYNQQMLSISTIRISIDEEPDFNQISKHKFTISIQSSTNDSFTINNQKSNPMIPSQIHYNHNQAFTIEKQSIFPMNQSIDSQSYKRSPYKPKQFISLSQNSKESCQIFIVNKAILFDKTIKNISTSADNNNNDQQFDDYEVKYNQVDLIDIKLNSFVNQLKTQNKSKEANLTALINQKDQEIKNLKERRNNISQQKKLTQSIKSSFNQDDNIIDKYQNHRINTQENDTGKYNLKKVYNSSLINKCNYIPSFKNPKDTVLIKDAIDINYFTEEPNTTSYINTVMNTNQNQYKSPNPNTTRYINYQTCNPQESPRANEQQFNYDRYTPRLISKTLQETIKVTTPKHYNPKPNLIPKPVTKPEDNNIYMSRLKEDMKQTEKSKKEKQRLCVETSYQTKKYSSFLNNVIMPPNNLDNVIHQQKEYFFFEKE